MTGLIWFVQIVHYPLFAAVGESEFKAYANAHRHLTTTVVVLPMIIELATSIFLVALAHGPLLPLLWFNLILIVIIWLSTAFFSVPCHEKLCSKGFLIDVQRLLVKSNWSRTILWSIRSGVIVFLLYKALRTATDLGF